MFFTISHGELGLGEVGDDVCDKSPNFLGDYEKGVI